MRKGSQKDANMEPKIIDFSCFFKKGENARNHCIYKLKRGSGHAKSDETCIKNRCKIDAGKIYAKIMQIMPKWDSKSVQNRKNTRKKGCRK